MFDPRILVPLAMILGFGALDRRVWALLSADPAGEKRVAENGVEVTARSLLVVIVLAVGAFFIAKQMHHRELGLYIAIGVLVAQAIVNAIVRLRAFAASSLGRDLHRRVARVQLLATVVTVAAYVSVLAYLQRWY